MNEALIWGILGWFLRVVFTYWKYSKMVESKPRGRFIWTKYRKKYDQDWIFGFVAMVCFSLIAEWAWESGLSSFFMNQITEYNDKVNVFIGFSSILIAEKLAGTDHTCE